jgi:hypothetical protein
VSEDIYSSPKIFRTCEDCLKYSEDLRSSSKFFSDGYSDERILKRARG